jgi:hypothetical protein
MLHAFQSKRLAMMTCVGACLVASPPARATVIVNRFIPIELPEPPFVPCADGGSGEYLDLSGSLHDMLAMTLDSDGTLHVKIHDNPQGVIGVGETTGDEYRATGVTDYEYNVSYFKPGGQFTVVNNFRMIGPGPGNNLLVHENTHYTFNADGTLTATVDNFSIECR